MSYIYIVMQKTFNCSIIPVVYYSSPEVVAAFSLEKDAENFIRSEELRDVFLPKKEYVIHKTMLDPKVSSPREALIQKIAFQIK